MKTRLKHEIADAFREETPDLRDKIIKACENEPQLAAPAAAPVRKARTGGKAFLRRFIAVAACAVLFAAGLLVGKAIPAPVPTASADTLLYLDVNPSIELSLDGDRTVLSCEAKNTDAETVLAGLELQGVKLKTALSAIVGAMYVKGYLSADDNSMLISVDSSSPDGATELLQTVTEQVKEVFDNSSMECSIIAQSVKADESLIKRASDNGISVGKMYLLDKMVSAIEDLSDADVPELSGMSIKDLNLLYTLKPEKGNSPDGEVISGKVNGYVTTEQAYAAVLERLGKTENNVAYHSVYTIPYKQGGFKVMYSVTVKLKGDDKIYVYEVDCKTGEVYDGGSYERPPQNGDDGKHDVPPFPGGETK